MKTQDVLKQLREKNGWTQEQMAEMTAFPLSDYELYEKGGVDLPFSFIIANIN